MCGIAGFLTREPLADTEEILYRMMASLRHRGPDESGAYFGEGVALGQTRLSIIGLDDGTQPISNEDQSLWIVYNGETFNYPELRVELEAKGHRFATSTDTEVVLHLYEEYGVSALSRINGQFALAIWDNRSRELFLARDRMGIRPLYYTFCGGRFLFSSEIKSLFQDPEVCRELDPKGMAQAFMLWTAVAPRTPFKDVQELPPGQFLRLREARVLEEGAWWKIPYIPPEGRWQGTFSEAREEVASLVKDAVRLRLRADVPVGAYLSGGLDSSIITALVAEQAEERLRTFSMSFQESAFDETPFQQEMIRTLATEHRQVLISNQRVRDHLAETIWHCEKPLMRTSPVPLLLLSRLVRESGYKVVLTGEGADEVFGGYNIFKEAKVRAFWARQPDSRWRPLLLERLYPYIFQQPSRGRLFLQQFFSVSGAQSDPFSSHRVRWRNGERNFLFFSDTLRETLQGFDPLSEIAHRLPADFTQRKDLDRAMLLEMEIFLSNYLLSSQGDRVAMANSLELRLPYLDVRLIEFASRLPAHWKIRGLNEKHILKEAFRNRIPPSITARGKQPYRAPIQEAFFCGKPDPLIGEVLSESHLRRAGLFHPGKVQSLLGRFAQSSSGISSETRNMALTGIVSGQLLHHLFVDTFRLEKGAPEPVRVIRDLPSAGRPSVLSCA